MEAALAERGLGEKSTTNWTELERDLYDLREHQVKALGKLSNGKILWGGVGTGKSRVAAAYYHKNEAPKRVYVITTAKKRDSFDWQDEFYRIGIGPATGPVPIPSGKGTGRGRRAASGGSGDRRRSEQDRVDAGGLQSLIAQRNSEDSGIIGEAGIYPWVLTVDSWNNIAKYADIHGAFFIFDEQRLVGSGDWTRKFLRIAKHNNWILLSGTPGDTWMDYIPVFVANNFYKNRTAFKREHVVYNTFTKFPKVDRYINVGKLMRHRADLLVEMPYDRHTKRRIVEVPLKYDKEALEMVLKKRWHIYENRPLRDVGEMFLVGRKLVNSDPSRLEMVKELWKNHPKLIVFYNFNFELEELRSLRTSNTLNSQNESCKKVCCDVRVGESSGRKKLESSLMTSRDGEIECGLGECVWGNQKSLATSCRRGSKKISTINSSIGNGSASTITTTQTLTSTAPSNPLELSLDISLPMNSSRKSEKLNSEQKKRLSGETSTTNETPIIGEWNGHRHDPIPDTSRWIYLVQYTAGAEGWNCIETDAMIMYSRNYSWKVTEQAYGRIDRLNTPFSDLWYYDFTTDSFIDRAIGRSLRAKETFNEAKYARLFKE